MRRTLCAVFATVLCAGVLHATHPLAPDYQSILEQAPKEQALRKTA